MSARAGAYQPIADYRLIGDCRTAALVSNTGSIDWLCAPRFDSPSLFARILDAERGGHFAIQPTGNFRSRHEYAGYSGVLKTTFETANGAAVLTDFMPLEIGEEPLPWAKPRAPRRLIRLIEGARGAVELAIEVAPRPDYGRGEPALLATARGLQIQGCERLHSPVPLSVSRGTATATTTVRRGEQLALVLELDDNEDAGRAGALSDCLAQLKKTLAFWDGWCRRCVYRGLYEEAVMRSALTLKLLTYAPTGAMVAAPTSSLPEEIGGVRNWDYRYTWIRDASFGAYALLSAGHIEDAVSFFDWICRVALRCGAGELQIMYGLNGEKNLAEYSLDHLEGYRRSRPVRIGNAACEQFQLDVYGELLDCFHVYRRLGEFSPERLHDAWPAFRQQVDHVAERWREPDSGIWEMRSEPRQFVYSKVMAWTALDRAIQAAEELQLPADLSRWRSERAAIRSEVLEKGYDPVLGSFTQSYGARVLDAATLLLPMLGFIDPGDERMQSTIEAIECNLMADGLVYRYVGADDGLPGGGDLRRLHVLAGRQSGCPRAGQRGEAALRAHALPGHAARAVCREIEPGDSAHLGNFPQALTHIALMNVAVKLARALGGERKRRDTT